MYVNCYCVIFVSKLVTVILVLSKLVRVHYELSNSHLTLRIRVHYGISIVLLVKVR